LFAACALAAAATTFGSCSTTTVSSEAPSGSASPREQSAQATELISRARAFREFQLYYLGMDYGGLFLTAAEDQYGYRGGPGHQKTGFYLFVYGDCEVDSDPDHPSCVPPMQLQVHPLNTETPLYVFHKRPRARVVRGALTFDTGTIVSGTNEHIPKTTVYTGHSVIDLDVDGDDARRAVSALRPIASDAAPTGRLPTPQFPTVIMKRIARTEALYRRLRDERRVASALHLRPRTVSAQLEIARALRRLGVRIPRVR
jgi:hypothetical protein